MLSPAQKRDRALKRKRTTTKPERNRTEADSSLDRQASSEESNGFPEARPSLSLPSGVLPLPCFLPDATLGVVRSVDSQDLESVGIQALVMNVFHLMQKPGSSTIAALGGLHRMAHWSRPIITDSGGFQAYSLIRQHPKMGALTEQGIRFQPEGAERGFLLTPEKSVQLQLAYGADVVICLDDCTHVDDSTAEQQISVQRTIRWARRCKDEFVHQLGQRKARGNSTIPLLFGVIQGGGDLGLREECAQALLAMGFDGFGYGGWPLDARGKLLCDLLQGTRALIPNIFPMHALGVGHPESVVACARMGYSLFDCALPTRDARTGRLYYSPTSSGASTLKLEGKWFDMLYIDDEKHIKTDRPIWPGCDCPTCAHYAVGYLRHLHKCGDTLFFRLATLHNLRFMTRLMETLQASAHAP